MYKKPILVETGELAEGVYVASGADDSAGTGNTLSCQSVYMSGNWQIYNASGTTYKSHDGCLGCPADNYYRCTLSEGYVEDNGHGTSPLKPTWEVDGHSANEAYPVTGQPGGGYPGSGQQPGGGGHPGGHH